jgi:hypothetical protein
MANNKQRLRVLSEIADCVRMCFSSAHNRRSARTGRRPRKAGREGRGARTLPRIVVDRPLRAARANRAFCADEKRIRTESTVMDKGNTGGTI